MRVIHVRYRWARGWQGIVQQEVVGARWQREDVVGLGVVAVVEVVDRVRVDLEADAVEVDAVEGEAAGEVVDVVVVVLEFEREE